jgi:DedD protein
MAFFKFRKGGDEPSAAPVQPDSIEVMRRRAKYRLIGAAVLVLIGVFGFPLLFDKQPRPIAVDLPIEIPDRNKAKPLVIPAPVALKTPVEVPVAHAPAPMIDEKELAVPVDTGRESAKKGVSANSAPDLVEKAPDRPVVAAKPAVKAESAGEGAKALALLEGRTPDKNVDASEGRFVVQIGAFADAARAREVRAKVEHAGLKTYTHVAQTKDGSRIRVRVGPLGTRAEADKVAEKIKKLGLSAAILTL